MKYGTREKAGINFKNNEKHLKNKIIPFIITTIITIIKNN